MANITSVARTVGANRIVPTFSIPCPLGDPSLPEEQQKKLRRHRVGVALDALTIQIQEDTIFEVQI
jgi:glycine/betaine/sarcosine/D-proline reductase family selenoprotein B